MKTELLVLNANNTITSLELLKQINIFRREDSNKNELLHKDLLKVIRDEFSEEIQEREISPLDYEYQLPGGGSKKATMFELTIPQAKQVLVRESKFVRKAIIKRLEELEAQSAPKSLKEALYLAYKLEEEKERLALENKQKDLVIEEKNEMLDGLLNNLSVADKRKVLIKLVTKRANNYKEAWDSAYSWFEITRRTNLQQLLNHHADKYKPRLNTKLDVIDRHLKELDILFKIMVKLREDAVLDVVKELFPGLNLVTRK